MPKNLIVGGCSFTADSLSPTWATYTNTLGNFDFYQNLARGGAGNFYISNSTINYLATSNLPPADTMVIIMWSGSGRKDIRISGEWYYYFKNRYFYRAQSLNNDESEYYLFSGGLTNSWADCKETKKIFEWAYKLSDPVSLCKDTLTHILTLENYLKAHGYQYCFLGYVNQWSDNIEYSELSGDYSIGYFLKDTPMYQSYSFDSWIFTDQEKNCIGEFAEGISELDSTGHPTAYAHQLFSKNFIMPALDSR